MGCRFSSLLNLRFPHFQTCFHSLKVSTTSIFFYLIAPYVPPSSLRCSNKILLIVPDSDDIRSGMDSRYFFLLYTCCLELSSLAFSFLRLCAFRGLLQTIFISKVSSAIVSLHTVSSNFYLRTLIQWTLLSSMRIPGRFILAEYLGLHGRDAPDVFICRQNWR